MKQLVATLEAFVKHNAKQFMSYTFRHLRARTTRGKRGKVRNCLLASNPSPDLVFFNQLNAIIRVKKTLCTAHRVLLMTEQYLIMMPLH